METCVGSSSQPVETASSPLPRRFTVGVRGVYWAPYLGTLEATARPTPGLDVGLFGSFIPQSSGALGSLGAELIWDATPRDLPSLCLGLSAEMSRYPAGRFIAPYPSFWLAEGALDVLCVDWWRGRWEVQGGAGISYLHVSQPSIIEGSAVLWDLQLAIRHGFDLGAPLR